MKKKLLIFTCRLTFVSVLAWFSISCCFAEEPELPPPLPHIETTTEPSSPINKESFWDKILNFFGFGPKLEVKASNNDKTTNEKKEEPKSDKQQIVENESENLPLPALPSTDESSITKAQPTPTAGVSSGITNLKLPDGFDPDQQESGDKTQSKVNEASEDTKTPETEENKKTPEIAENKSEIPQDTHTTDSSQSLDQPQDHIELPKSEVISKQEEALPSDLNSEQKSKEDIVTQHDKDPIEKPIPATTDKEDPVPIQLPESSSEVSEYRKHLQERLNKNTALPTISKTDLVDQKKDTTKSSTAKDTENIDPKQLKFINDEAQVLILPNGDLVLGKLTEQAQLDLMDFSSYVKIFWDNYNLIKHEPAKKAIDDFINTYDNKQASPTQKEIRNAFIEADEAIDKSKIYELIPLVDNYPILNLVDQNGDTLLHKAVQAGNYSAVKLLLMKGSNPKLVNYKNLTALDIAIARNKVDIITLLRSAGL